MDILNNINLNGNTITSATLNNSVIGSNTTTTPGAIKYGSGLMCVLLQKKQMNGVSVKMTTSFDVKIVKIATKKYRRKNKLN